MKEKVLDYIVAHPWTLIPLALPVAIGMLLRYKRIKRRLSHVSDFKSKAMVGVGLVFALIIIGVLLAYT